MKTLVNKKQNFIVLIFTVFLFVSVVSIKSKVLFLIEILILLLLTLSIVKKNDIKFEKPRNVKEYIVYYLTSLFISFGFYKRWLWSGTIAKISAIVLLDSSELLIIVSFVLSIINIFSIYIIIKFVERKDFLNFLIKKINNKYIVFIASLLTFLFYLSQVYLPLYSNTDNFFIANVLSGVYSSDENYCNFLGYGLSKLCKLINIFIPNADSYTLLSEMLGLFAIFSIIKIILKKLDLKKASLIYLLIIVINLNINILHAPFTLYSAFLGFYGISMCFYYLYIENKFKYLLLGIIYIIFSINWRLEAFLLLLPFLLLIFCIEQIKKKNKKLIIVLLIIFFIVIGEFAIKQIINKSEKYIEATEFNTYRSQLVDYPTKNWSDIEDELQLLGVSENDYKMIKKMILMDSDLVSTSYLKKIANISSLSIKEKISIHFLENLNTAITIIKNNSVLFLQLFAVALLSIVEMKKGKVLLFCGNILSVCGSLIMQIYFIYNGHIMAYVIQTILVGNFLYLICTSIIEERTIKYSYLLIALLLVTININEICFDENAHLFSTLNAKENDIVNINGLSDENNYIWRVYDFTSALAESDFFKKGKLFNESFISSNFVDGEWQYKQIYYEEYLERNSISNLFQYLINNKNTYYIVDKSEKNLILEYAKQHYDAECYKILEKKIVEY